MVYLTLTEIRAQLSIVDDDDTHDDRLTRLADAAEAWAANFLNADLVDYENSPATSPPELPEDIKSALLMHIEFEFDRDVRNGEMLLKRAHDLLWPYRENVGL